MSVQDRDAFSPAPPSEFPGWYADPFGEALERFWNGRRWTEKLKDEPTPPVDPAAEPVAVDSPIQRRLSEALSTPSTPGDTVDPEAIEVTDSVLREPARPGSVFALSTDRAGNGAPVDEATPAKLPRRPPSLFSAAMRDERARVSADADADTVLDLAELERAERPSIPAPPTRPVVRASVAEANASGSAAVDPAVAESGTGSVPAGVPAPPGPVRPPRVEAPKPARPLFERADDGGFRLPPNDEVGPLTSQTATPTSIARPPTVDPAPVTGEAEAAPPGRRRAPFWLGLAAAFLCVFGGGVVLGSVMDDAAPDDPAELLAPAADETTDGDTIDGDPTDRAGLDEEIASLESSLAAAETELAEAEAALTAAEADLAAGAGTSVSTEELDGLRAEVANLEAHREILLTWFTAETRSRSQGAWDAEISRACDALAAAGASEATAADVNYTNWLELMGTEADLVSAVTDCLAG